MPMLAPPGSPKTLTAPPPAGRASMNSLAALPWAATWSRAPSLAPRSALTRCSPEPARLPRSTRSWPAPAPTSAISTAASSATAGEMSREIRARSPTACTVISSDSALPGRRTVSRPCSPSIVSWGTAAEPSTCTMSSPAPARTRTRLKRERATSSRCLPATTCSDALVPVSAIWSTVTSPLTTSVPSTTSELTAAPAVAGKTAATAVSASSAGRMGRGIRILSVCGVLDPRRPRAPPIPVRQSSRGGLWLAHRCWTA